MHYVFLFPHRHKTFGTGGFILFATQYCTEAFMKTNDVFQNAMYFHILTVTPHL